MTQVEARALIDARTYVPVITTAAELAPRHARPVAERLAPVRVLPYVATPVRSRKRLAGVIAAGSALDVAILGAAGRLVGLSAAGREIGLALVLLALLGALALALIGSGRVHCPGCPR
jgi:hypothetical protein